MALLENGTQINTIMLGLWTSGLSDLIGRWVACIGLENTLIWPIGYVIIWVQVDRVQGYGEDQIALVILDLSYFVAQVPMVLGTPMIGCIMNVIEEKEIDTLAIPWVSAWVAYLLAIQWATATVEDDRIATKVLDPTEYNEVVTTKGSKMIDAFLSKIIHAQTKTSFMGARLNVMTHALCADEGPLPKGLMIQNTYTGMCNGSKDIAIVMRNSTSYPQTLKKKIPVVRVVASNWLPELQV